MFTSRFWRAAAERAIKTAAQSAVVLLGADYVDILSVDWSEVGVLAAGSALLSILTSLASARVNDSDDPSLV